MSARRSRPPTAREREVLYAVLAELRRAMRLRTQLTLVIDPFLHGDGVYVFAAPSESGRTYVFESTAEKARRRLREAPPPRPLPRRSR